MPDDPVSAEEVAHRRFSYSFRGFDPGEVRDYLDRVAEELRTSVKRERELQRRVADAEHRAAHPVIDEDVLTQSLGEETSRILASAHDVARELKARAEDNAARILREAHAEAQRIRASAEVVLSERTEEAEQAADQIRQAARSEMEAASTEARREAHGVVTEAEHQAARMLREAEEASARVMKELSRRRRIAHAQVEQLLAGRERLLEAYRVVRRTLEEVGEELKRAEPEARQASEAVARRAGIDLEPLGAGNAGDGHDDEDDAHSAGGGSVSVAADTALALARSQPAGPQPETAPGPGRVSVGLDEPAPVPPAPENAEPAEVGPDQDTAEDAVPDAVAGDNHALVEAGTSPEKGSDVGASDPGQDGGAELREDEGPSEPTSRLEPAVAVSAPSAPSPVAELFARIKAGRSEAVAEAEALLGGIEPADASPPVASPSGASAPVTDASDETAREGRSESAGEDADVGLLKRRDAALESITSRLSRKLKRALQDEQNEVLDRLRSHRGVPSADVLPPQAEQAGRYALASADLLEEAAIAGASFVSPGASPEPGVTDLADALAETLVAPLRRRLQGALEGDGDEDPTATAERIGAAYREWKTQLVERLAADATVGAFSRAAVQATPGAPLRWVVDDDGGPCPDCYDNALAGPTSGGDTYPTGQEHPPAHPGCRCLLVPVTP